VRLLLDSHVLLWWLADDAKLSAAHRELIADGANNVFVSAITIAELGIKSSIGKLDIPDDLGDVVAGQGFDGLPFTGRHALALRGLPWHHRDPFDRMLISQATTEGLVFLTADARCREYDVVTG
jgi:PIN domain nuclease of toxin-antitoxin system